MSLEASSDFSEGNSDELLSDYDDNDDEELLSDDYDDDDDVASLSLTTSGVAIDNYDLMDMDTGIDATEGRKRQLLLEHCARQCRARGWTVEVAELGVELIVHVAFSTNYLEPEKAMACGIDKDRELVLSFSFSNPSSFLVNCPDAQKGTLSVRQYKASDLARRRPKDFYTFGLWWTLEQRLDAFIATRWDRMTTAAASIRDTLCAVEDSSAIRDLMELLAMQEPAEFDRLLCAEALKACKGSAFQAMTAMQQPEQRKLFEQGARLKMAELDTMTQVNNFLILCVEFIEDKIDRIADSCLICDAPHKLRFFKPTICHKDLCNFSFVEYGLGVNIESEIQHAPQVVDLLICQTLAAATQNRVDHFKPFPSGLDTDEQPIKVPNDVKRILSKLPSVETLQQWVTERALKQRLRAENPSLMKLLQWIITTNRCHLELLPEDQQITEMQTKHQFILKSTPPDKEALFQELKKKHGGSFFAFHGSPFGNWHSILRNGLKNKNYRTAYGPGIYFAKTAATSSGYAGSAANWKNSMFGTSGLSCMALCEIIDHGTKDKCLGKVHRIGCSCKKNSPYYRVEDENMIVTRFLFVWNARTAPKADASKLKGVRKLVDIDFLRKSKK